eukprot:gnl/MRDRNA2_/MRDRNA2_90098_c0_seq1.p1 gnl/MRDRNA2_/MRDRNA2_90098_c0~~gnl/MRDRNA2_/MRDRNA2_90098_c0_seq1.p1  ORF type:complete len:538 (-),score=121.64 gnl/MRDRNA2_/MRDRNA2_90098_c0_seq1:212-1780(-)
MAEANVADDYMGFEDEGFEEDEPLPMGVLDQGGQVGKQNSWESGGKANATMSTMATSEDEQSGEHDARGHASDWQYQPTKRAQPANQQHWQQNTIDTLHMAKALMRDAHFQMSKNDRAKQQSDNRHQENTTNVSKNLRSKITKSTDLVHGLEARIDSVEDTIRQTGECLFQLQRAHRSKWAPLNVCERRLELRDGRPLQELVRDHLQEALEHERRTLIEARQELSDQIQATKEMLSALEKMKQELLEDLQHKRHAMRIDRSCLQPDKPHGKEPERFILPALPEVTNYTLPPSPKETARGTGEQHEGVRQSNTQALISRALRLEENAMRMCNENDAAMLHTKRETSRANAATSVSLDRRVQEVDKLKNQLEAHIRDTDATIAEANRSLQKTKKKLDSHEAPLRCLNKQFTLRDRRTDREHIRDPVTDEMESHLDSVKKSVGILTAKWQATKNILDQLKKSRQQMTEDYKCKMIASKIDDACRKVTPKKAIELDRLDPRGGRCHPDAKKSPGGRVQAILDNEFS